MRKIITRVDMARLEDRTALKKLLGPVPHGAEYMSVASEGGGGLSYSEETQTAYYMITGAEHMACFQVSPVDYEEALAIRLECMRIRDWLINDFEAAVARGLGGGTLMPILS
jgi:hypothetical protein